MLSEMFINHVKLIIKFNEEMYKYKALKMNIKEDINKTALMLKKNAMLIGEEISKEFIGYTESKSRSRSYMANDNKMIVDEWMSAFFKNKMNIGHTSLITLYITALYSGSSKNQKKAVNLLIGANLNQMMELWRSIDVKLFSEPDYEILTSIRSGLINHIYCTLAYINLLKKTRKLSDRKYTDSKEKCLIQAKSLGDFIETYFEN